MSPLTPAAPCGLRRGPTCLRPGGGKSGALTGSNMPPPNQRQADPRFHPGAARRATRRGGSEPAVRKSGNFCGSRPFVAGLDTAPM